jgi:uncharacterized Rmd1/YagE family protein
VISIVFVVAVAVVAAWNFSQNQDEAALSDLALENVEALADGESGNGSICYNTITTQTGIQTLYCGTCTYVSGSLSWVSGTGKC